MSQGMGQTGGQFIGQNADYRISRQFPKAFTPFPPNTSYQEEEILPYMARIHSPVRVSFSPTTSMKRKSRISNQTETALFNFRPIKRGDRLNFVRFKPPDSTLPSLQYLSPWISVTKGDYRDPRDPQYDGDSLFLNSRSSTSLQKSASDIDNFDANDNFLGISNFGATFKTNTQTDSQSVSRIDSRITRDVSAKTQSSDKRVTFNETPESRLTNEFDNNRNLFTLRKEEFPDQELDDLKKRTDFYSGYLPPELSEKLESQVTDGQTCSEKSAYSAKERPMVVKFGQFYKPLIGDRSLFMRESYPTKPIIYQSDIDQLRFEGHERLMKSTGQAPAHFSVFKDRGSLILPKNKGMHLEEALKKHQRLSKSADHSRVRRKKSSIEIIEGQRDRTYAMQRKAREIINRP